ncbi:histidine phosphatase family protein [Paenibacillus sp. BSR1-1]|uniref:histidine phosphatase family protein n=1 Tax=Paenibacillus sp. BSR1-1 TaxID=3020845 RepID=UPI0025AEFACF|nr:histidine phosphatase family protein [Paenibacillus sp. BSR1-1]MDN3015270.1 histidine phosphatase family protein [Paenibacillus sp. BSR1-1]
MVIALFRHGMTEANRRKVYLGWEDSPLCPESMHFSTNKRYECYFSSDLKRCQHTAEILFPDHPLILLNNLREMNFGKWEGKTYANLKEDKHYQSWLSDPMGFAPPDGESLLGFTNRIGAGWKQIVNEIMNQNRHRVAVITHSGVIRMLLTQYARDKKSFWDWGVEHDKGYELIFEKEALRRGQRCTLLQEVPLTVKEPG